MRVVRSEGCSRQQLIQGLCSTCPSKIWCTDSYATVNYFVGKFGLRTSETMTNWRRSVKYSIVLSNVLQIECGTKVVTDLFRRHDG